MKTGLPRQVTVIACPGATGVKSTSDEDNANTSAAGFML
ncbi:hypothetical protein RIEGSTA812A_PEG_367 [invertebrate metagenome]|uniref:Uncharacterized protein n=1 Tax=invertebrate metagenome TaxID=1711999 RepID=A0A484H5W6_9ZZZZ